VLKGTLLSEAQNLTQQQLERAVGDIRTILPGSLHHPDDWLSFAEAAPKQRRRERRDHYRVLGLARRAQPNEIRKAFHKLAREFHPDLRPGDRRAEVRFNQVNAAYQVLKDTQRRALYDRSRSRRVRRAVAAAIVLVATVSSPGLTIDPGSWATLQENILRRVQDLQREIVIALRQAAGPGALRSGRGSTSVGVVKEQPSPTAANPPSREAASAQMFEGKEHKAAASPDQPARAGDRTASLSPEAPAMGRPDEPAGLESVERPAGAVALHSPEERGWSEKMPREAVPVGAINSSNDAPPLADLIQRSPPGPQVDNLSIVKDGESPPSR
jgi:curved DNA-binding protein CbpA